MYIYIYINVLYISIYIYNAESLLRQVINVLSIFLQDQHLALDVGVRTSQREV